MIITTEGIVLRQRKIANNRRMIVIFTKQYGKLSAGTSVNEKSRSKAALALRPFTYAEYDIFKGREAFSINTASVSKSFYSIGEDIDRFMAASAFSMKSIISGRMAKRITSPFSTEPPHMR